jgi:hypothetical protein
MPAILPTGSGPGDHGHRRRRTRIRRSSSVRRRTNMANRIPRSLPPHPEDAAAPVKPPLLESLPKPTEGPPGAPQHFLPPKP